MQQPHPKRFPTLFGGMFDGVFDGIFDRSLGSRQPLGLAARPESQPACPTCVPKKNSIEKNGKYRAVPGHGSIPPSDHCPPPTYHHATVVMVVSTVRRRRRRRSRSRSRSQTFRWSRQSFCVGGRQRLGWQNRAILVARWRGRKRLASKTQRLRFAVSNSPLCS